MSVTQQTIDRYIERLKALYGDIEQWSADLGLRSKRDSVQIDEGIGDPYPVDALLLYDESEDLIATIQPEGANIIGAEGQIRIIGKYDWRIVTYFVDKGPSVDAKRLINGVVQERFALYLLPDVNEPGWYLITNPKTGQTRQLDAGLFKVILAEVSDYGI